MAGAVGHYTFVSSISVYEDFSRRGFDEGAPVLAAPEPEEPDWESYGELKVGCERAAEAAMPGRTLVIRPGMIVGPHDYTNRLPYWCRRVAEGGEVLAPGDPARPVQLIDGRDLAVWMLRMVSVHGALEAGLAFRPLTRTVGDALDGGAGGPSAELAAGMTRGREGELLRAWRGSNL